MSGSRIFCVAVLASVVRARSVPLHAGMEAFLERLRPGLGTLAPVLTGYGLETEADFAQLHDDDVAAEEVWALLEANGCKRLQARAILKGMGLDPDLQLTPPSAPRRMSKPGKRCSLDKHEAWAWLREDRACIEAHKAHASDLCG